MRKEEQNVWPEGRKKACGRENGPVPGDKIPEAGIVRKREEKVIVPCGHKETLGERVGWGWWAREGH